MLLETNLVVHVIISMTVAAVVRLISHTMRCPLSETR